MKTLNLQFVCLALLAALVAASVARAVPAAVQAKSEYLLADKLFNQKDYNGAIQHAEKAKSLLGKSKPRIEYMLTKAYYEKKDFAKAFQSVEAYFRVTPESESATEMYLEMVELYALIEQKAETERQKAEAKAQAERKRIEAERENAKAISEINKTILQNMVTVPRGCYDMGYKTGWTWKQGTSYGDVKHPVCVSAFSIGKYEVTQDVWLAVMGNNPSANKKGGDFPVENVSWYDVEKFLKKLNTQTGLQYRLPTEAEWEYAARSGGREEKYSGGSSADVVAWHSGISGGTTHQVGMKFANGFGLYDMSGNVFEWCQDWWDTYYYEKSPRQDPKGPSYGKSRLVRGGSFRTSIAEDTEDLEIWTRFYGNPDKKYRDIGFRLVHP